jgi:hypothetical protein
MTLSPFCGEVVSSWFFAGGLCSDMAVKCEWLQRVSRAAIQVLISK